MSIETGVSCSIHLFVSYSVSTETGVSFSMHLFVSYSVSIETGVSFTVISIIQPMDHKIQFQTVRWTVLQVCFIKTQLSALGTYCGRWNQIEAMTRIACN